MALWPSGRIEAWAIAPGVPSLSDQEREDQVPDGSYHELARSGGLAVDAGRAVPGIERVLSRIWAWSPAAIVSDPYRAAELHQVVSGRVRIIERARGGGEATSTAARHPCGRDRGGARVARGRVRANVARD